MNDSEGADVHNNFKEAKKTKGFQGEHQKLLDSWDACIYLAYANLAKSFTLHVDARREGLGGILYQEHDKKLRPDHMQIPWFEMDCGR